MDEKITKVLEDVEKKIKVYPREAIEMLLSVLPDSINVKNARRIYDLLSVAYKEIGDEEKAKRYEEESRICTMHCNEEKRLSEE